MPLADPAFRAIFEDAPIGICVVDKDLNVVDANAAYCADKRYLRKDGGVVWARLVVTAILDPSGHAVISRERCPDCQAKA